MKNKNILILIIVLLTITTIAATSTAVYFGLNQNKQEETTQQENEALKQENEELKLQIQDAQVQNEEKVDEYSRFFKYSDELNVVNKNFTDDSGLYYEIERTAETLGVSAILQDDNSVFFTLGKLEGDMSFDVDQYEYNPKIEFGDRKIQNVYCLGAGQSGYGNCVLFLMEDGTVEYMPLAYAIKNNDFRSYGKLEGVENVVDIVTAYIAGGMGAGSGHTALVIQEDGTAYDIGEQLRNIYSQYNTY